MKRPKLYHVLSHQHPLGHQHLWIASFSQKPLRFELPTKLFPHLPRPVLFIPNFNPRGPHTRRAWKAQRMNMQSPGVECPTLGRFQQLSCAVPQGDIDALRPSPPSILPRCCCLRHSRHRVGMERQGRVCGTKWDILGHIMRQHLLP